MCSVVYLYCTVDYTFNLSSKTLEFILFGIRSEWSFDYPMKSDVAKFFATCFVYEVFFSTSDKNKKSGELHPTTFNINEEWLRHFKLNSLIRYY